ncbi:MAG: hypothetical protein M3Z13_02370 [Candidatus Dormibacteraeota bacterium]|nr:hypothetical protein [Candidatus Dormibacteraeota bacterium]
MPIFHAAHSVDRPGNNGMPASRHWAAFPLDSARVQHAAGFGPIELPVRYALGIAGESIAISPSNVP